MRKTHSSVGTAAIVVVAMLLGGCSLSRDSTSAAADPTFAAAGVFAVEIPGLPHDGSPYVFEEGSSDWCAMHAGLSQGLQVVVRSPKGIRVGLGKLSAPTYDQAYGTCDFTWKVPGIPVSDGIFSLEVPGLQNPTYFRRKNADNINVRVKVPSF